MGRDKLGVQQALAAHHAGSHGGAHDLLPPKRRKSIAVRYSSMPH
jgi:hypothetical protein